MAPLHCQNCGAAIVAPDDLEHLTMTCAFCKTEQPIPNLEEHQQALHERLRVHREEEEIRERKEAAARVERGSKRARIWAVVGVVALLAILIGGIGFCALEAPTRVTAEGTQGATKPTDPIRTGMKTVKARVANQKKHGCRILNEPETYPDDVTAKGMKISGGSCVTVIAATGVDGNVLTLQFRDAKGDPLNEAETGIEISTRLCPKKRGRYGYTLTTSNHMPFSAAELDCGKD